MSEAVLRPQVCIVGAGPAGAAASLTLSQKGIAHLVVEADHFPRHKPCGDILTSPAIRAMNRLDPDLLEALKAAGQVNPIWQTHTFPPNGKPITIDFLPLDGREGIPSCYSVSGGILICFCLKRFSPLVSPDLKRVVVW
jgi:2-polyprenyl-6-methoxyphenol hydroxylase-like FAD-dependent oxidoreductase